MAPRNSKKGSKSEPKKGKRLSLSRATLKDLSPVKQAAIKGGGRKTASCLVPC
jgi:hypothetical protein